MINPTDSSFTDLVGQIFEASISNDRSAWESVFGKLSTFMSADAGTLNYFHKKHNFFDTIANTNDPRLTSDFNEYYFNKLPYREEIKRLSAGETFVRKNVLADDKFEKTEIYQDLFRTHGVYHVLHYCLAEDKEMTAGITFTRGQKRKDFSKKEIDGMSQLLPYLTKAMQLHLNVLKHTSEHSILKEAWDHLAQGILIVSKAGKVIFKNSAADKVISGGDGIGIGREGKLVGSTTRATSELHAIIASVFGNVSAKSSAYHGGAMLLQRSGGLRPLSISVTPFAYSSRYLGDSQNFALMQITDPDESLTLIGADLRSIYSLTNAEAQLAKLLAEGLSLTQASEQLNITRNAHPSETHLQQNRDQPPKLADKTDPHRPAYPHPKPLLTFFR